MHNMMFRTVPSCVDIRKFKKDLENSVLIDC